MAILNLRLRAKPLPVVQTVDTMDFVDTGDPEFPIAGRGKLKKCGTRVCRTKKYMIPPGGEKPVWYFHYVLTSKKGRVVEWLYNIGTGTEHTNIAEFEIVEPATAGKQ